MRTSSDPAAGPLAGIRVVESGRFASAPSCATVLADWGAEVIKLEPLAGDPARGPGALGNGRGTTINPRFDVHNRSRRSVAVDLKAPGGREVADRLIGSADVFVTNMRPGALRTLGLDSERLRTLHPRLVYAQVTGYGGRQAGNRRSYDHGAFWSYSGMADLFSSRTGEPPQPAGGMGDRATGSSLAGAVCAALFARERTGEGAHVSTSLLQTALWLMASDFSDALQAPDHERSNDRMRAPIPTVNCFRCGDGKWLWLQSMLPDRDWDALLTALDAKWLDDDPRFRGGDRKRLASSRPALIEALDEIFRQRTAEEWTERLSAQGITVAPVRRLADAPGDPVVAESGSILDMRKGEVAYRTVNSPVQFTGSPRPTPTASPYVGEHTDQVLQELGMTAAELEQLRATGALAPALPQPTVPAPSAPTAPAAESAAAEQ